MLPLHGTVSHIPAEHIYWEADDSEIRIHARVSDERIFSHKLVLNRTIVCSLEENTIAIKDTIVNRGDTKSPVMILYHMNMGYPLLSEKAVVKIPSVSVKPRNDRAAQGLDSWSEMLAPQAQFEEQCYYHSFDKKGQASIFNPEIGQGLEITFDADRLAFFTEWKMMGQRDYVLGLEPGNCTPDGRDRVREAGDLTVLEPGESVSYEVHVAMVTKD